MVLNGQISIRGNHLNSSNRTARISIALVNDSHSDTVWKITYFFTFKDFLDARIQSISTRTWHFKFDYNVFQREQSFGKTIIAH